MTHETNHEATAAPRAPLDGAEDRGPASGIAGPARDDEPADFLRGIRDEIVGEARKLLARWAAE